jgi:Rrf2 family transcriptional regulator, nitric oxide-sensitive transcriptional repressor
MELSQFTDYSLRVLIHVSLRDKELSSVKEIATAFDISQNHLGKVVNNLAKLGYLETFRGKGGGIALNKPAEKIGIGEVVRVTENLAIVECFPSGKQTCCIAGVCELQTILGKALQAFLGELDKVTLADLMKSKPTLRKRLGLS